MELFYRTVGTGRPLIVLHGVFGSGDNWLSVVSKLSGWQAYLPDLRNHGQSPWDEEFSLETLSSDVVEFIQSRGLEKPVLLGHSLGAKICMETALRHPDLPRALVAVDMSPRSYEPKYPGFIAAMKSIDLEKVKNRTDALGALEPAAGDRPTAQFLLKNLVQSESGAWRWRINLEVLERRYDEIWRGLEEGRTYGGPSFFLYGENSDYVETLDKPLIRRFFPATEFHGIPGAGHWVHSEKPQEFQKALNQVMDSLGVCRS